MMAWMLYAVLVAALLSLAAQGAERAARLAGGAGRWAWVAALVLSLALPLAAAWRGKPAVAPLGIPSVDDLFLRAAGVGRAIPPLADRWIAALWMLSSATLLLALAVVAWHLGRWVRTLPTATVNGVPVRVAPHAGPAVIGVVRPAVVVPRWLLARDAREQRAVVAHEREHVASGDHLLLAFASAALALAPWNPLLWYAAARLRLAIELDCDARVVAAGADRRSYATLLIDVAQLARPFRLNALAIAGRSPSHLRRRIVALAAGERRHPRLRAAAATAVTAMALGAASYAPVPAASRTREAARGSGAGFPGVVIDGEMASAAQLAALDRARIASVEVVKGPAAVAAYGDDGANGVIVIRTTGSAR